MSTYKQRFQGASIWAFDIERVAKKFFTHFQIEHKKFLTFIDGIAIQDDREWYASIMLSRLMFVYFIQRQGLLDVKSHDRLDGNTQYLHHHLKLTQEQHDPNHTFYRYFLLRLFHEGFCIQQDKRTLELNQLLGKIPYVNSNFFDVHRLERDNPDIQIADEAFERIFAFFDKFSWCLHNHPNKADNEINPDVLGYIFEKYLNRRQMGTYYTKGDISEYISKHTIIPYLFEATKTRYPIAFEPQAALWSLLCDHPDDYIYEVVAKGTSLPLPPEIEAGLHDIAQRGEWNQTALDEYALPTETWREVVARRARYQELCAILIAGEITSIDDLITYNLNIRAFAQDVITNCGDLDLLLAFYESISRVRVLDPMCGSGAFLLTALDILEPLYDACLERMKEIAAKIDQLDTPPEPHTYHLVERFRETLKQVQRHPNRTYFILKSIITNNLHGVDIIEEAAEICKLRLFLKLISQVTRSSEIELPLDLDLNIHVGNTLTGFATLEEVHTIITRCPQSTITPEEVLADIEQRAKAIGHTYHVLHLAQTALITRPIVYSTQKQHLHTQLEQLNAVLDHYLALEDDVARNNLSSNNDKTERYQKQPFHWCIQFYEIMRDGGFDVIIGNPPYVEYDGTTFSYMLRDYETLNCANLYAYTVERCHRLLSTQGSHGMIVPLAAFATKKMVPLIEGIQKWFPASWLSFYHFRPAMLFSGGRAANIPTAIYIARPQATQGRFSTHLNKWRASHREVLFDSLVYCPITIPRDTDNLHYYPKFGSIIDNDIMNKVLQHERIRSYLDRSSSENTMYYRSAGGLYWKLFSNVSWPYQTTSNKQCHFKQEVDRDIFVAVLNSSLFWWYYTVTFDTFNLKDYMLFGFRFTYPQNDTIVKDMKHLCHRLIDDISLHARHLKRDETGSYTVYVRYSKPIIDEIDRVLARHYGFTDKELDFIINYDIKYRIHK